MNLTESLSLYVWLKFTRNSIDFADHYPSVSAMQILALVANDTALAFFAVQKHNVAKLKFPITINGIWYIGIYSDKLRVKIKQSVSRAFMLPNL